MKRKIILLILLSCGAVFAWFINGREKIDDRSAALLLQQFFDESSAQS